MLIAKSTVMDTSPSPLDGAEGGAGGGQIGGECTSPSSRSDVSDGHKNNEFITQSNIKQETAIIPNMFNINDQAFLQLAHLINVQHQMQAQAAQQQRVHMLQQQQQQQHQQQERKRSYPCTFQFCVICQKDVHSSKLPCHIRQCHVAKPMFQCPACDFTSTYSKNNVKSHMVSLHGLAGDPISFMDQYAAQVEEFMKKCFPNVRGRGRPMQGRTSPRSPASPQRRNSQHNIVHRRASLVQPQEAYMNQMTTLHGMNAMSIFPQINNNSINVGKSPIRMIKAEDLTDTMESGVVSSSASSFDDLLQNFAQNAVRSSSSINEKNVYSSNSPDETKPHRYLSHNIDYSLLSDEQCRHTIFSLFPPNSNIAEKLDLSSLIQENLSLFTVEQIENIRIVREKIQLQDFEIMFALHRMDLSVLNVDNVDLVSSIAPSSIDILRFRQHEQTSFGREEQFVFALSKIERLEEKLAIMQHMGRFNANIENIQNQMMTIATATTAVQNCPALKVLLQLVLLLLNTIFDLPADSIKGFKTSELNEICNQPLPNGQTLLSFIADTISEKFPEITPLINLSSLLQTASTVNMSSLVNSIHELSQLNTRALIELENGGMNVPLAEFIQISKTKMDSINQSINNIKEEVRLLLLSMGESLPPNNQIQPEYFFLQLYKFISSLENIFDSRPEVC